MLWHELLMGIGWLGGECNSIVSLVSWQSEGLSMDEQTLGVVMLRCESSVRLDDGEWLRLIVIEDSIVDSFNN